MNYKNIYTQFIADRLTKQDTLVGYTEKHHILPRSFGGSDDADNLIKLTAQDHFFAHLLLAKIYGGKMAIALHMMKNTRNVRITSSQYAFAKKLFIENFSGDKNPMAGKGYLIAGDKHYLWGKGHLRTGDKNGMSGKGHLIAGDKNSNSKSIILINVLTKEIKNYSCIEYAKKFLGINTSIHITNVLSGKYKFIAKLTLGETWTAKYA